MDKKDIFPQIKKGIEDFMQEEEGNISRSKVAMIGSMMVILGVMLADSDVFRIFDTMVECDGFAFLAIGRPEAAGCYCSVNSYLKEKTSLS